MRLLRPAAGDRALLSRGGAVAVVAVDTLGADRGAAEVAAGAAAAAKGGIRCLLYGPRGELERAVADATGADVEFTDAPVSITSDEEPARAVRSKPEASIVQAAMALAAGRADALVSAGSTGAALAASTVHVKRLPGVYRPAIAVPLPLPNGTVVLLDVGANVEVRPEHLVQFAHMGAAFSEGVLGVRRPRVGLLSVGEERGKGNATVAEAHERLSSAALDFAGNVEGGDIPAAAVDVVVTDGFTGNVALKLMEGTAKSISGAVRAAARSGPLAAIGGLLLRPKLASLRERLDPERTGGAYLLGLRKLVVICHGSSSRRAIENAVLLADRGVRERVVERTAVALAASGVLRGGGGPDRAPSVDAVKITG